MKLRSRVMIGPTHGLGDDVWNAGNAVGRAIALEWNMNHRAKIDDLGLVVLDSNSAEYEGLRRLFLSKAQGVPPEWLEWNEKREGVYSKAELEKFEILRLHINGTAGLGGNIYAQVYESSTCEACGLVTIGRQVRNLVTNVTRIKKDFAATLNFSEDLISSRVHSLLREAGVTGVEFRPVEHARPSRPAKRAYFQLIIHNVLEPLLAPRRTWTKHCPSCGRGSDAKGIANEKPDPWSGISLWGPGPWGEMHFPRGSYRSWDLMRTADVFGGSVLPSDPSPQFPALFINQRLYRLLRQHEVTGFWIEPAHLD